MLQKNILKIGVTESRYLIDVRAADIGQKRAAATVDSLTSDADC